MGAGLRCTPLTFLLSGFGWLLLSVLLGLATLIGLVNGTPLPAWLKLLHVHGTLIGGLLQLLIGGLLFFQARVSEHKDAYSQASNGLFLAFNGATLALLLSFLLGQTQLAALFGLILLGTVLSPAKAAWRLAGTALNAPTGFGVLYRVSLAALVAGLAVGVAMALRVFPELYAHARLLHIHLLVLGFVTVTFVVAAAQLVSAMVRQEPAAQRFARWALWSLPAGFAALIGGFVTSSLWFELIVGSILVVAIAGCASYLVTTWVRSGLPGTAASDHLLIGMVFLVLASAAGVAMGANYLSSPPVMPIGSLHLVAYTHLAFIGFMLQAICAALSYGLPILLANSRVPSQKKREPYREQLDGIMNRWRTIQLGTLSLGTMGLAALAALVWSMPLGSWQVQTAVWVASGFLLAGLMLFTAKVAWTVGLRPTS